MPTTLLLLATQVEDRVRNETAYGTVVITVVDLTEEAVMQSGSFRVVGYSSNTLLQQQEQPVSASEV